MPLMSEVKGFARAGRKMIKRFGQGVMGKNRFPNPEAFEKNPHREYQRAMRTTINSTGARSALGGALVAGAAATPVHKEDQMESRKNWLDQEDLRDMKQDKIQKRYAHTMASTQRDSKDKYRNSTLGGTALGAVTGLALRKKLGLRAPTAAGIGAGVGSLAGAFTGLVRTGNQVKKREKSYMNETKGMTRDQLLHHIHKKVTSE